MDNDDVSDEHGIPSDQSSWNIVNAAPFCYFDVIPRHYTIHHRLRSSMQVRILIGVPSLIKKCIFLEFDAGGLNESIVG